MSLTSCHHEPKSGIDKRVCIRNNRICLCFRICICIISTNICNILICMQKHSQHNKDERTHFFRKIYLSLYSKGLRKGYCERGKLETEQRRQHIDPQLFWLLQHFFPVLLGCSTGCLGAWGPWGPASARSGFHSSNWNTDFKLWSPTDLNFLSHRVIYLFDIHLLLVSVTFCTQFNLSTVKVIPWYLRLDAPVIYTGAFLIWQLARVGGQYVTHHQLLHSINNFIKIISIKYEYLIPCLQASNYYWIRVATCNHMIVSRILILDIICNFILTHSARAVKWTDCISPEGVRAPPSVNMYPGYDTNQSDGEAPVMLELWGMWNTPS